MQTDEEFAAKANHYMAQDKDCPGEYHGEAEGASLSGTAAR